MPGLIFLLLVILSTSATYAVTIPTFPTCAKPQGSIKVDHREGTHGIVGDLNTYIGSDTVHSLTSDAVIQCFCSVDGRGIQTNWWKISSLTSEEIVVLKSQGWKLVPNGTLWGLEETAYLAQNSNYNCLPAGEVNSTTVASSSNSNNLPSSPNSTGEVLAAATSTVGEVLGLADTGSSWKPYLLAVMGFTFICLGLLWLREF